MPPLTRTSQRFEQATLPMAAVSLEGELLRVNAALCRLLGRSEQDLVGTPVPALLPGPTGPTAEVLAAVRGGAPGGEVAAVLADAAGRQRRGRVAWHLVRDPHGQPAYLTVLWVDEAWVDGTQPGPLAGEAHWWALLGEAADCTWTADDAGTVLTVTSGVGARSLSWQPADLRGRVAVECLHPDDRPLFLAAWRRLLSGGSAREVVEGRLVDATGRSSWVRQTLRDLRRDPLVRAVVGHVLDIAEERQREQDHVRLEARFRATFEQSSVPQTVIAPDGTRTLVNRAFCELVDRPAEELLGRPVEEVSHPSDSPGADVVLGRVLAGELESAQYERVLRRRDGRALHVLVSASLLRDADGRPDGATTFLQDLSTLRDAEQRRAQQEAFFLALSQRASDLALVTDTDARILYASPGVRNVLGYDPADLVLAQGWASVHAEDRDPALAAFRAVVDADGARTFVVRVRDAGGTWRWMEVTVTNLLDTAVGGMVANLRDVTERVEAERALRRSELRYRAIADTAQEGIWAATPDGTTLYANQRMAEILGLPLPALYAKRVPDLLGGALGEEMRGRLTRRGRRGTERYEVEYLHPDGAVRVLAVSATPLPGADGAIEGSLGMVSDVTEVRRTEQELRHAALHDALTGLPNRTLLLDRLEHALARQASTAVLFVDLDQFKMVNDSRGHGAGDQLLVAVARRLSGATRPSDTVARFGGDEFVVVCEDVDEQAAIEIARDLLAALHEHLEVDGAPVHVRASLGVAVSSTASAGDLLRYADTAMYSAKLAGRGRVRLFDPGLSAEAEQRWSLGSDLRAALTDDTLVLHYQPVVDLASGRVLGVEALARWQHPEHGAVPPSRFVHLAELIGLGPDLDRWVVRRALSEGAALLRSGALPAGATVAVNLSARHIADPELEALVASWAEQVGMPATQVVLEITETELMDDRELAVPLLRRLRARGFQVAVDDFGTGYSSLAYLRDLPVTSLKVDRSFVSGLAESADARAIVGSVLELARALGLAVVAEGVETPEQAAVLRELGCGAAQGWLWSRAVPSDELRAGVPGG